MPRAPFDLARQDRLIEALERGESIAAACRFAPCSKDTCFRWLRLARAGQATPEQAAFANRFERAVAPPTGDVSDPGVRTGSGPLSEAELVELLEAEARDGHVVAIRLLLERPWERRKAEPAEPAAPKSSLIDQLAARRRVRPA